MSVEKDWVPPVTHIAILGNAALGARLQGGLCGPRVCHHLTPPKSFQTTPLFFFPPHPEHLAHLAAPGAGTVSLRTSLSVSLRQADGQEDRVPRAAGGQKARPRPQLSFPPALVDTAAKNNVCHVSGLTHPPLPRC